MKTRLLFQITFVGLLIPMGGLPAEPPYQKVSQQLRTLTKKGDSGIWLRYFEYYKKNRSCLDGKYGKEISGINFKWLDKYWNNINELLSTNQKFQNYLISTTDASVPRSRLNTVKKLADTSCPKEVSNFCQLLTTAIDGVTADADSDKAQTASDLAYKKSHLTGLKVQVGSKANVAVWKRLIQIAGKKEDEEIASKIFSLNGTTDGGASTMYCHYVQQLFDANPLFFVKSAGTHFSHDYNAILPCFVSESETELGRIEKAEPNLNKKDPAFELFTKFLTQARSNQSAIDTGKSPY